MVEKLKPADQPYEVVQAVFANFDAPSEAERGGFVRAVAPSNNPAQDTRREYAADYHVEASFSPEQRPYIAVISTRIKALLEGRVIEQGNGVPRFAQRIVQGVTNQLDEAKTLSFVEAFTRAKLGVLTSFGAAYPNLLPGISPFYASGGISGTLESIKLSRLMLHDASVDREKQPMARIVYHMLSAKNPFVATHPFQQVGPTDQGFITDAGPREYEVWCPGIAIARTMVGEASIAAYHLAGNQDIVDNYDHAVDDDVPINTGQRLRDHIDKIATSTC